MIYIFMVSNTSWWEYTVFTYIFYVTFGNPTYTLFLRHLLDAYINTLFLYY